MENSLLFGSLLIVLLLLGNGVSTLDDWLVTKISTPSELIKIGPDTIRLTNGIVQRDFLVSPDFVTIDFFSLEKQSSLLRAVGPEALVIMDELYYNIGGVVTNIPRAYLNRTDLILNMTVDSNAFHYVGHSTGMPIAPFKYRPKRGAPKDIVWPPKGLRLDVDFKAPFWAPYSHHLVTVTVHYEMYDGIPLISKWISITGTPSVRNEIEVLHLCNVSHL